MKVNGTTVASGTASAAINLAVGNTAISTVVSAAIGINTRTYTVTVTRLPDVYAFNSATDVPVTAGDFVATGKYRDVCAEFCAAGGHQSDSGEQHGDRPDSRHL